MIDEIAGDKTKALRQSKTRQFYGFVGETNYNEAFIEELYRDFEESGYDCGHIPLQLKEQIVLDPEIAHGKPVIRGTRAPVAAILDALAGGIENR
jgi:hypothetical protein